MWRNVVPVVAVGVVLALAQITAAGQMGWWAFDDGAGTTAKDGSGKGNHGTLTNGPTWVDGKSGKALKFDGVDDYVLIPHNAGLCVTTEVTISVWINPQRTDGPNASGYQGIVAKSSSGYRSYNLYTRANGTLHFSTGTTVGGGAYVGSGSTGTVPLNQWTHIVVKVEGGVHKYFLNGQPSGTGGTGVVLPGTADVGPVYIGRTSETNREFQGLIDEVRLYDVALTDEQIKDLFNNKPPSLPKARTPTPADGATGVTSPLFTWTAGENALFHDVYLGTTPDLTAADKVAARQPFAMYWHIPGLQDGVTYYWRIDEIAPDGTVATGDVWSFQTTPVRAWAPAPADDTAYVKTSTTLAWTPGQSVLSHDVYVGTSRDEVANGAPSAFKGNVTTPTLPLDGLLPNTTYFWRVDEVGPSGKQIGAIWQFTTRPALANTDPNLMGWWTFDEGVGTTAVDWSGHDNDGTLRGNPQWVSGYSGSALKFDGVRDYVEVPHSETLIVTKEITVMAWINAARHSGPGGVTWQGILAKGNTVRSYSFYTQTAGTLHFSTTSAGAYVGSSSTGTVPLNEWVHVAAMIKGGAHEFFLNGQSAGTGSGGITPPGTADTDAVWIGATHEGSREFQGMIDDPRIYNIALTLDQLRKAMQGDPTLASNPQPGLNAGVDIRSAEALSWSSGEKAAQHDVYFGRDRNAVATADPTSPSYQGRQTGTSFPLEGQVEFGGGAYFWRIDEVEADGTTIHRGAVWSFTVPSYLIIDEFEEYDDVEGSRVFDIWVDGYTDGLSGSMVGYEVASQGTFGEKTIVHGGRQSMPMDYNNTRSPFYSEAVRTFAPLEDWTEYGVTDLSLWFRGNPIRLVDKGNGAFTIGASGHDIWDNADDFRFVYKQLNGNGSATVKVESLVNTNAWAKAGVMIRDSLDPGSTMAYMIISYSSGASFGWRQVADGTCGSATQTGIAAPQWVKLTRTGNAFTAQYSADGKTWKDIVDTTGKPVSTTVMMGTSVYIGRCVTSHNSAATTTAELSGAATTGTVTGLWKETWIGDDPDLTNDAAGLYAVIEDSTGKSAMVTHPNPAAANIGVWTEWKIPLSSLTGVNLARVKKLYIGVGDKANPAAGGAGTIYVDDVRLLKP